MQHLPDMKTGNHLLDALSAESLERLQPHLEPVALVLGEHLQTGEHVYFPVAGMISVVATTVDGGSVGIGMVGRRGMYRISSILSDHQPCQGPMVQLPGCALRLKTHLLRQEMQADGALQRLLLRYIGATMAAVRQSAACNRLHSLEQRCARWLLELHDRADTDTFSMTHEFLAMMLGVRRPGVSLAAHTLQEKGLITYAHGAMTVLDRHGLEAAACECYRVIQDECERLWAA